MLCSESNGVMYSICVGLGLGLWCYLGAQVNKRSLVTLVVRCLTQKGKWVVTAVAGRGPSYCWFVCLIMDDLHAQQ